jgi:hypothetical protein
MTTVHSHSVIAERTIIASIKSQLIALLFFSSMHTGYEAADGSFKEETRGTDCVVRGKYGYVDPDVSWPLHVCAS